jgi:AraC-like DNA-binding protein
MEGIVCGKRALRALQATTLAGIALRSPERKTPMIHRIQYQKTCLAGLDAMRAESALSYPRHTHDQYGIGVMDRGVHASASDGKEVQAGPGNLIFVNPGEVHDGRASGDASRVWRMLYFDPKLMLDAQGDVLEGVERPLDFPAAVAIDPVLQRLFNALYARATGDGDGSGSPLDAMACEAAILQLAAHLRQRLIPSQRLAPSGQSIRRAKERIDTDPAAPLTLAELAGVAGVSRYQLHRNFMRELGFAPHAYILQQRIALARRLIRSGTPLADAALAAGFYDQSHLNRWFLRIFGVSPGTYAVSMG